MSYRNGKHKLKKKLTKLTCVFYSRLPECGYMMTLKCKQKLPENAEKHKVIIILFRFAWCTNNTNF